MTLKKDDVVELLEKDDNGWWLVKMNGVEGWAPNNYLELVPKADPAPLVPAPPPRKAPGLPKVDITLPVASPSAKPVSVFPGMAASDGSAAPWKKAASSNNGSPAVSRPPSSIGSKPPPPVAAKPKPPPIGAKPTVGKPVVPTASRPGPTTAPKVKGSVSKPPTAPGQVDLAAAVSILFLLDFLVIYYFFYAARETCSENE